jgi:hypothetical protein
MTPPPFLELSPFGSATIEEEEPLQLKSYTINLHELGIMNVKDLVFLEGCV